ncbi:MAG: hypothetical protein P1P88_22860 [Bacteroidales bacterium]|nr:hypothetical protein [Bacteroidales bacterium]
MVELFTYAIFSLTFSTSYQLSGPEKIGLDAEEFVYNDSGKDNLWVTFVLFSVGAQESMEMTDTELLNYAKSTFLGTSKAAVDSKEREVFGIKSVGEVLSTNIPLASDMEIHFITMKNGDKICVSFKSIKEMNEKTREAIIVEILGSLKEEA